VGSDEGVKNQANFMILKNISEARRRAFSKKGYHPHGARKNKGSETLSAVQSVTLTATFYVTVNVTVNVNINVTVNVTVG